MCPHVPHIANIANIAPLVPPSEAGKALVLLTQNLSGRLSLQSCHDQFEQLGAGTGLGMVQPADGSHGYLMVVYPISLCINHSCKAKKCVYKRGLFGTHLKNAFSMLKLRSGCLSVCQSVSQFVCLFVCLRRRTIKHDELGMTFA